MIKLQSNMAGAQFLIILYFLSFYIQLLKTSFTYDTVPRNVSK